MPVAAPDAEILEELEYLVAQTDNARTIANLKGWPAIVRTLSAPTDDVATAGAWAVGSAVKLDAVVQDNALDAAVMPALIKLLHAGSSEGSAAARRSASTRTKAVFALGHLLRSNRRAQRLFATHKGPELLLAELRPSTGGAEEQQHQPAIGLTKKILALVADLLEDPVSLPSMVAGLHTVEWCASIAAAAAGGLGPEPLGGKRQAAELAVKTMLTQHSVAQSAECTSAFFAEDRAAVWQAWHATWEKEAQQPGEDGEYPEQLAELMTQLMKLHPK
eukprot:COSAG05_NODE_469_length_9505_cov_14.573676_4_plen_276_part_00